MYGTWVTEIDFRNRRQNNREYALILLLDSLFCLAIVSQSRVAASVFLNVNDTGTDELVLLLLALVCQPPQLKIKITGDIEDTSEDTLRFIFVFVVHSSARS